MERAGGRLVTQRHTQRQPHHNTERRIYSRSAANGLHCERALGIPAPKKSAGRNQPELSRVSAPFLSGAYNTARSLATAGLPEVWLLQTKCDTEPSALRIAVVLWGTALTRTGRRGCLGSLQSSAGRVGGQGPGGRCSQCPARLPVSDSGLTSNATLLPADQHNGCAARADLIFAQHQGACATAGAGSGGERRRAAQNSASTPPPRSVSRGCATAMDAASMKHQGSPEGSALNSPISRARAGDTARGAAPP